MTAITSTPTKYSKIHIPQETITKSVCGKVSECAISTAIMKDPEVDIVSTQLWGKVNPWAVKNLNDKILSKLDQALAMDNVVSLVRYKDNSLKFFVFNREAVKFVAHFDNDKKSVEATTLEYKEDWHEGLSITGNHGVALKAIHDNLDLIKKVHLERMLHFCGLDEFILKPITHGRPKNLPSFLKG